MFSFDDDKGHADAAMDELAAASDVPKADASLGREPSVEQPADLPRKRTNMILAGERFPRERPGASRASAVEPRSSRSAPTDEAS